MDLVLKNCVQKFVLLQPYVAKNVDPLIFRGGNDPDRTKHNLGDLGHFTAIVTAKSNKIGCGMVKDPKLEYKVNLKKLVKIYRQSLV